MMNTERTEQADLPSSVSVAASLLLLRARRALPKPFERGTILQPGRTTAGTGLQQCHIAGSRGSWLILSRGHPGSLSLSDGVREQPQKQGAHNEDGKPDGKAGQDEPPGPGPPVHGFLGLACLMPLFRLWGQVLIRFCPCFCPKVPSAPLQSSILVITQNLTPKSSTSLSSFYFSCLICKISYPFCSAYTFQGGHC